MPILGELKKLLEMVRFSHTLFALPFSLLASLMAWRLNAMDDPPSPFRGLDLIGILVCMVTARSAAMAFNRLVDREIDARNPRTAGRHLPAGTLSVGGVVVFTVLCCVGFVLGTLLFLPRNPLPLVASLPVLLFLLGYSYAKRWTALAHFWLGAALMLAPIAAWVAVRPVFAFAPLVLGAAVALWVAGFDILYACQDFDFDRRARLRSIPAAVGIPHALRMAALCHVGMLAILLILPAVFPLFGAIWYTGVLAITLLLAYEHWLVRPDDLARVNMAFFHVNAVVSVGLLAFGAADLYY